MKGKSIKKNKIELIQQKAQKALYYNTFIQLIDNEKAIIENCKRIVECNDILVKLLTRNRITSYNVCYTKLLRLAIFYYSFLIIN